jgi:hypothetical protein
VLLIGPENWKRWHRGWFRGCAVLTVLAVGWYVADGVRNGGLPGGSSWPGLTCGVVAGLLMLYLFAFGLRKGPVLRWWFARRPTKYWLAQHIWLGLLTLPLVVLHAGLFTRLGVLTLTLVLAYAVVLFSGIWGLWQQQRLPRQLLEEVADETLPMQLPDLLDQLRQEAELLVLATCGPPSEAETGEGSLQVLQRNAQGLRAVRTGKGTGLLRILPPEPVPDSEPLRRYFADVIEPYLWPELSGRSRRRLQARFRSDFAELRSQLHPEAHGVLDALEQLCERRRQFDHLARLHGRLHSWIVIHLAFSAVLVLLLIAHAVLAILYW